MRQEVTLGSAALLRVQRAADVIADVHVPWSALHELPIHQAGMAGRIDVEVPDVGIAVEQAARLGVVQQGRELAYGIQKAIGVAHLHRNPRTDGAVEIPADLPACPRACMVKANRGTSHGWSSSVPAHVRPCRTANCSRLSATWSAAYGLRASRNVAPCAATSPVMTTPCWVTGSTSA